MIICINDIVEFRCIFFTMLEVFALLKAVKLLWVLLYSFLLKPFSPLVYVQLKNITVVCEFFFFSL